MLKHRKKGEKREKGQAMVEFALILPLLILLLCGIIDFGWIFGNQLILNNAVREAARNSAINFDESKLPSDAFNFALVYDVLESRTDNIMDIGDMVIPVPTVPIPTKPGDTIKVSASYPLPILTPVLSTILGGSKTIQIHAQSSMRLE